MTEPTRIWIFIGWTGTCHCPHKWKRENTPGPGLGNESAQGTTKDIAEDKETQQDSWSVPSYMLRAVVLQMTLPPNPGVNYFSSLRWCTVPQQRPEVNGFKKKGKKKVSSLTYTIVSSWPGSAAKHCLLSCEQYPRKSFRILWRLEEETDLVSIACPNCTVTSWEGLNDIALSLR